MWDGAICLRRRIDVNKNYEHGILDGIIKGLWLYCTLSVDRPGTCFELFLNSGCEENTMI